MNYIYIYMLVCNPSSTHVYIRISNLMSLGRNFKFSSLCQILRLFTALKSQS